MIRTTMLAMLNDRERTRVVQEELDGMAWDRGRRFDR